MRTIHAVGDNAVIDDVGDPIDDDVDRRSGSVTLASARGTLATWTCEGRAPFACLAHPPRLAVAEATKLWLVDSASGEVAAQLVEKQAVRAVYAFSPDGGTLLADVDNRAALVDESGGIRFLRTAYGDFVHRRDGATFSADGTKAILWGLAPAAAPSSARVDVVDVATAKVAFFASAEAPIALADDAYAELVYIVRSRTRREGDSVVQWRIGARARTTLVLLPSPSARLLGLWASRTLDVIAAHDNAGGLHVRERRRDEGGHETWKRSRIDVGHGAIHVDVDRDRVITGDRRLRRLSGVVVSALSGGTAFSFAGGDAADRVEAAYLVDGALHVVTAGRSTAHSARLVEGPRDLRAIAPHPRGVIALDDAGRVHVFDL